MKNFIKIRVEYMYNRWLDLRVVAVGGKLNKEITVTGYKIGKTKYSRGGRDQCLTLEIELDGAKHVVFTGSGVLIDQMEKYGCQVPFVAEIVKINKYYRLK